MFKKANPTSLEDVYFAKHLNFNLIKQMMNHEGELTCYFGGMNKEIMTKKNAFMSVSPTVNKRIPCRSDWWAGGKKMKSIRCQKHDGNICRIKNKTKRIGDIVEKYIVTYHLDGEREENLWATYNEKTNEILEFMPLTNQPK